MDTPVFDPSQPFQAVDTTEAPAPTTTANVESRDGKPSFDPNKPFETGEEHYGTTEQMVKTGLEGAARGLISSPLTNLIETKVLGVKPEDIRGREEEHPYIAGGAEAAGFVGGAFLPFGQAALLSKAGEAIKVASGIGEATQLARVGSAAAQQAAEMAILQSGNEISKQILQDPDTSAQQAIANVGLASALGGAGGAFVTGAISPLWKATVGPKLEGFLSSLTSHIDDKVVLPEVMQKSVEQLGVEPHPIMQAALSGNPKALEMSRTLYRAENPEFMGALRDLQTKTAESVTNSLGVPLEEAGHFSNKIQGDTLEAMTKTHIDKEYGPIAEALNKRDAESAKIMTSDDSRIHQAGKIMEEAIKQVGTDSPYYNIYEDYAQRLLGKDDIHGIDTIRTELYNNTRSGANVNEKNAWNNIRNMLGEFRESQITKQAAELGSEGKELGAELLAEHAQTNQMYHEYANKLDKLSEFLGIGDFRGTGTFKSKLDDLTAEKIVKKFATKGDVEGAEFLNKNFPEIAEQVRKHEAKQFLSPVVKEINGEYELNIKGLNTRVDDLMKGSPEYAHYVLPKQALDNIKAAKIVNDNIANITGVKNSGTPAGIMKIFANLGSGVGGAIGWMAGHNPISGAIAGHIAQVLSVDAPQAIKLAMLKHMASDVPIKAEGFKAMIDMMQNTIKGEGNLNKAAGAVFKSGTSTLISNLMPKDSDLDKLDKLVSKTRDDDTQALSKKFMDNSSVGHYMPAHQTAMTTTTLKAVQYLKGLKPQSTQLSPLDTPLPPSDMAEARYKRALTVAENPLAITQHIKNGTLQATDIEDLKQIYPAMYPKIAAKLTSEMANKRTNEEPIPYHTRMSLSLFLGQPLDSSMTPSSIMAAQPIPKAPPPQQGQATKGSTSKLGKSNNSYKTAEQTAESDRSNRD